MFINSLALNCGVDLEVRDGETLVIIGSSGTGKSILLKNIAELMKPDTDSVKIDGIDITKCSAFNLHEIQKKNRLCISRIRSF